MLHSLHDKPFNSGMPWLIHMPLATIMLTHNWQSRVIFVLKLILLLLHVHCLSKIEMACILPILIMPLIYIYPDCLKNIVTPSSPREQMGLYWGYKVRYASNLSRVFKNCPFKVHKRFFLPIIFLRHLQDDHA